MKWSASQYSKFLDDRTRPARDLLAAVPLEAPRDVVDVGCGPGNSTALLLDRYPEAAVIGIDTDEDMISAARKRLPSCTFTLASAEEWHPPNGVDLIFANASLQWAEDHERLFPRLLTLLNPGGCLAVQMPDNLDEPSHLALREVSEDPRWRSRLGQAREQRKPLIPQSELYRMLRPICRRVDVWRTVYHFELAGLDSVVEWFKGSALGPYLQALDPAQTAEFLLAYRETIASSYPVENGRVLLPFPRYFFIAMKEG